MVARVGINGFGRIGRSFFRVAYRDSDFQVVAVNDITDARTLAHLLKYDTVLGRFEADVRYDADHIFVDGQSIRVLSRKDPAELPWKELGVDIVIESTGLFTDRDSAAKHLTAGARRVIISAPAKKPDVTICMGVNHELYDPAKHFILSNASCTTNCLAPVVKVLLKSFGFVAGFMCTTHAYTNDQRVLDLPHRDLRRARAAAVNIIPTTTGAAIAVGEVIPEVRGRLDGIALRVPVPDVSAVQLTAALEKTVTVGEVNQAFRAAAEHDLRGILAYTDEELVSSDYIKSPYSAVVDGPCTRVVNGNVVSVVAWYDNEWGFSARLRDLVRWMIERGL
ncbi:MAG: type I glyceraldehyde-3-phosphate dehydrogenase [Acidobacteria bacterium]|nr:type I glyceraldehyde-3-phosphate dehydrogenase [Acidobacteriota bacterium]MDW7984810.1 type I glyceraldehyde-3-phosphate dehydrogenase [Acidobacteriota bacterium]